MLCLLLETPPPSSQLMLLSTGDPVLPLASRRVASDLLELRADQLSYEFEETRALSVRRGTGLSGAALNDIHQRTEGWPAGVELALRAANGPVSEGDNGMAHGTQREIAEYLLETVLDRASAQQQTFLLATSVLRRMTTAPLCDAVLGTVGSGMVGSGNVLPELERSNSFVIPVDDHRS